jgi:hypothetical protein
VILVEGVSDYFAVATAARRVGRDLDGEGISIVDMEGAGGLETFLKLLGPNGFCLSLSGLCDADKEAEWTKTLHAAGIIANPDSAELSSKGFYVSRSDLEEELVRSYGATPLVELIDAEGEKRAFELFIGQPIHKTKPLAEQLRGFLATKGRKVRYAPLIVEKLEPAKIPAPLMGVLSNV